MERESSLDAGVVARRSLGSLVSGATIFDPPAPLKLTPLQAAVAGGHMVEGHDIQSVENIGTISTIEGEMVEESVVEAIRSLKRVGRGIKHVARELGLARNTVRKYWDETVEPVQVRPRARRLDAGQAALACALFESTAEGNAVVVQDLLDAQGLRVPLRTLQRLVRPLRQAQRVAEVVTTRFETAPGEQLQIDFGERKVEIGGTLRTVYFFVATLGFSRRCFVRAGFSQRQGEWLLGLEAALRHFGGVPREVLVDNARALIVGRLDGAPVVHPTFRRICADWGLTVRACRPYRARTKGKVESGVKYVKRNAIAGRAFTSLEELHQHLAGWMAKVDLRVHGTTRRRPLEAFQAEEAAALRPLPSVPAPAQRMQRIVANDACFDVDRARYSVPHRLARCTVEVHVGEEEVSAWYGAVEVARHRRGGPGERMVDPAHFAGLHRPPVISAATSSPAPSPLASFGRSLADYSAIVGGAP